MAFRITQLADNRDNITMLVFAAAKMPDCYLVCATEYLLDLFIYYLR
jgi:hypothetical protein